MTTIGTSKAMPNEMNMVIAKLTYLPMSVIISTPLGVIDDQELEHHREDQEVGEGHA